MEIQLIRYLLGLAKARAVEARTDRERGDVAEKIVIVGIFVALAIAVGLLITHAVTQDAAHIARQIAGSQ